MGKHFINPISSEILSTNANPFKIDCPCTVVINFRKLQQKLIENLLISQGKTIIINETPFKIYQNIFAAMSVSSNT
jgi:hypothetical protein